MAFSLLETLYWIVILVSISSLAYGSYTDLRSRTVNAFLFIPLMAAGFAYDYYAGFPWFFIIMGLVVFFFTFLSSDTYAYALLAVLFIVLSIFAMLSVGLYPGFQLLVISMIYAIGFQGTLFGIGDIKAITALMYSNTSYSVIAISIERGALGLQFVPTAIAILTAIAIFAVVYIIYATYLVFKHGRAGIKGAPFAMKFDESLVARSPQAFRVRESGGTKYVAYKIPFVVPVFLGYLLFLITGFLPSLL